MDGTGSKLGRDGDFSDLTLGWRELAPLGLFLVWLALDISLYALLGWGAMALAVAGGFHLIGRWRGWILPWDDPDRIPSPGRLLARVLRRDEDSWLVGPRWNVVKLAIMGVVVFASVSGIFAWRAAEAYQVLDHWREEGNRTAARVVEVAARSEEGWATTVTVRFATPSGPVLADVEVSDSSALDPKPGQWIHVVYDPAQPIQVQPVEYLDGHEADGIRTGALAFGSFAANFLVLTVWHVRQAKRPT